MLLMQALECSNDFECLTFNHVTKQLYTNELTMTVNFGCTLAETNVYKEQ